MYDILFQSVKSLIPLKETAEKALKRLGIENIKDLLFYKPYSYKLIQVEPQLSSLKDGQEIILTVSILDVERPRSSRAPMKIFVSCGSGNETDNLILIFFNKLSPFIFAKLRVGAKITVCGKVQYFDGYWQITHPDFIFKNQMINSVEPIYHLTYGIINKQLYGYILDAIKSFEVAVKARINFSKSVIENSAKDESVIFFNEKQYMLKLVELIKKQHLIGFKPNSFEIENSMRECVNELAAFELFANQVSLQQLRAEKNKNIGHTFTVFAEVQQRILQVLGFELTEGQAEAIKEIEADQQSGHQMMRLLQGDVGSGKTLVALLTMVNVALSGFQSCLMAPTDLLSVQHYNFFKKVIAESGLEINVALLTGKTSAKERRKINDDLKSGELKILIGTHALFQETISFNNLGYIIIDEQHRFGVEQRLELINKADRPDVLVMTATPIPRSLTMTMFGDMVASQIKTKPKNRLPIITSAASIRRKAEIIISLKKKIDQDERVYWVCPLIDRNDHSLDETKDDQAKDSQNNFFYSDVTSTALEIEKYYPGQVGILHGKIKAQEKDAIMQRFKNGEIKILVATTVIEVGIDVAEASLMIIENAEKFGLAQLHQLRGRVGRGNLQSHCVLIYDERRLSKFGKQRIEVMRQSNDGFYIAEQDLILRGGGEILGTRQSGEPEFYFAVLGEHFSLLQNANKLAANTKTNEFIDFQIKLFARHRTELTQSG